MTEQSWTDLQKEASDLNVMKRGATRKETEAAVAEARKGRTDPRTEQVKARRERVPLGGLSFTLQVPDHLKQPGFHYRFFVEKNIQRAMNAGFLPVMRDGSEYDRGSDAERNTDQWFVVSKGYTEDNKPSSNYLMKQPLQFFEEDEAYRNGIVDESDQALRGGRPTGEEDGSTYIPDGGSAIQSNREVIQR